MSFRARLRHEVVYDHISGVYDETVLERFYVNGDGADWIKAGAKIYAKVKFVLDRYHMHKYIITATSHLGGLAQKARSDIWRAINGKIKELYPGTLAGHHEQCTKP